MCHPHEIWSCEPKTSSMFHDFDAHIWVNVWLYLLNSSFCRHGTCTIGHSKDQGLYKRIQACIWFGAVSPWSRPCFMVLYALVILCEHNLQIRNMYCRTQQGLAFIRICWSIVTSTSDLEPRAYEINHVSWFWHWLWPYLLNPKTHRHGMCTVGHSKGMSSSTSDLYAAEHPCIHYSELHFFSRTLVHFYDWG